MTGTPGSGSDGDVPTDRPGSPAGPDPADQPGSAVRPDPADQPGVAGRSEQSEPLRPRVVVIGDVVLDRDVLGTSDRLAPDAPVPVVEVAEVRETPGGAGLTALAAAASGMAVTLVAAVADDDAGRRLRAALAGRVSVVALGHDGATRTKTRVWSRDHQLLRFDTGGSGRPVEPDLGAVSRELVAADVVLVSDYGAGLTHHDGLRELLAEAAARVPVVWDPHPRGGGPVAGVALVTPNLAEARLAAAEAPARSRAGQPAAAHAGAGAAAPADVLAAVLLDVWGAAAVAVTAGAGGAFVAVRGQLRPDVRGGPAVGGVTVTAVPAVTVTGGDPSGAGDRFAASAAAALARGLTAAEAVADAVADASAWVAGGGTAFRESIGRRHGPDGVLGYRPATTESATARPTLAVPALADPTLAVPALADPALAHPATTSHDHDEQATHGGAAGNGGRRAAPAISGVPDADRVVAAVRARGGTLVATGGCFDLLHAGHVASLRSARGLGDALVVLLNSDASVRRLKGSARPTVGQDDRARVLAALTDVDAVVVFDEDDPRTALARLRPDVWVKGGDYAGRELPEAELVRSWGGRIVLLPTLPGRSTTALLAAREAGVTV